MVFQRSICHRPASGAPGRRRLLRAPLLTAGAVLILLAGCISESNLPVAQVAGTYHLNWVNGEVLPAIIEDQQEQTMQVFSGRIILELDETCEFQHRYIVTSSDDDEVLLDEVETRTCTWSMSGTAINLRFTDGGLVFGLYSRNALWFDYAFDEFPRRFVYEREGTASSNPPSSPSIVAP